MALAGVAALAALIAGLATAGADRHPNERDGITDQRIRANLQCEGPRPVMGSAYGTVSRGDIVFGVIDLACDGGVRVDWYDGMCSEPCPDNGSFFWSVTLTVQGGASARMMSSSRPGSSMTRKLLRWKYRPETCRRSVTSSSMPWRMWSDARNAVGSVFGVSGQNCDQALAAARQEAITQAEGDSLDLAKALGLV